MMYTLHMLSLPRASHGVGRHVYLRKNDVVTMNMEGGGCIEETEWHYGFFNANLEFADANP